MAWTPGGDRWDNGRRSGTQAEVLSPGVSHPKTPPRAPVEQMLSTLESMIAVQGKLAVLLEEERKVVVGKDSEGLLRCLTEKEGLLGQLGYFEARRKQDVALVARELGAGFLTLREVIACVPEPQRGRLYACHTRLHEMTLKVAEANRANAQLVGQVLSRVKNLVGFLKGVMVTDTVYKPTGTLNEFRPYRRTIGRA